VQVGGVRRNQLSRSRRRRGAQVSGEIGDGVIDLVPHPADHGPLHRDDRARQRFVVEAPQVL